MISFLPAYSSPLPPSAHGLPGGFGRLKNLANQETVCDAINGALQANYLEATGTWPCEVAAAAQVTLREKKTAPLPQPHPTVLDPPKPVYHQQTVSAEVELTTHQIQDLADAMPELMNLQATHSLPMRLFVRIECGDQTKALSDDLRTQVNAVLEKIQETWQLKK